MQSRSGSATFGLLALLGCAGTGAGDGSSTTGSAGGGDAPAWAAPPLERAVAVRDGRSGEGLSFERLLDELAEADVVFLGETHVDETTHRVELAVLEGLQARREEVVLALEMFQRDVQPHVDDYLAGRIDEEAFLEMSRPWGQYRSAYRPLIERAKASGAPVVASNFPRPLIRRVATEGTVALESLEGDAKRNAPAELFPNTPAYWRRVDNAIRGHIGMMPARDPGDERLTSTQTLWDNSMGDACARALEEHPGALVLHVNGGFHSAYWDGTVRQLLLRESGAKVLTVAIDPTTNPAVADVGSVPVADYVVFAEARASDRNEGTWSVWTSRELKYDVHVPEGASDAAPVPLLIWLSDDGFAIDDGMALWKERLGDEVAIAVVEAPYREAQADLAEGGRWFWPDTFSTDVGSLRVALERLWGYTLRHQPVDPARVCLAGEGTGATAVAAVALLTGRIGARAVAFGPRRFAKIGDFPLPLPELRGEDEWPEKSLQVLVRSDDEADRTWWEGELAQYTEIGLPNRLAAETDDPWARELEQENTLRAALGLEARRAANGERRHLVVPDASPRARHWARLLALRHTRETGEPVGVLPAEPNRPGALASAAVPLAISPRDFEDGEALPRCPGAFGGTTVLVVPDDMRPDEVTAWLALEENDPLNAASRFHRLRVAGQAGEGSLADVLAELRGQGRLNVLVVPAVFHADAATMRAIQQSVGALEDRMTLHWLPGLGGRVR